MSCMKTFVIAMDCEAEAVTRHLAEPREETLYGRRVVRGTLNGEDTAVIVSGIGKGNAAAATQLALQNDHPLWREAFDKGVFITSEQNLLALLRMIQIAWTQVQQARNQQEVIDQARKLLDRVSDFVERFDKVGDQLQKANDTFSSAKDKLYNGQQSVVKAAKDMEKLGYKPSPKKQLPEPTDWRIQL